MAVPFRRKPPGKRMRGMKNDILFRTRSYFSRPLINCYNCNKRKIIHQNCHHCSFYNNLNFTKKK